MLDYVGFLMLIAGSIEGKSTDEKAVQSDGSKINFFILFEYKG